MVEAICINVACDLIVAIICGVAKAVWRKWCDKHHCN